MHDETKTLLPMSDFEHVPDSVIACIEKAMHLDTDKRFLTAAEFQNALQDCLDSDEQVKEVSLPRPLRKMKRQTAALAVVFVIAAILIPLGLLRKNPDDLSNESHDFNDGRVDSTISDATRTSEVAAVQKKSGVIRLTNRGTLTYLPTIPERYVVSFRWRWLDIANDPLYAEELTIGLNTTGAHDNELLDGVRLVPSAKDGNARLQPPRVPLGTRAFKTLPRESIKVVAAPAFFFL